MLASRTHTIKKKDVIWRLTLITFTNKNTYTFCKAKFLESFLFFDERKALPGWSVSSLDLICVSKLLASAPADWSTRIAWCSAQSSTQASGAVLFCLYTQLFLCSFLAFYTPPHNLSNTTVCNIAELSAVRPLDFGVLIIMRCRFEMHFYFLRGGERIREGERESGRLALYSRDPS